MRVLVYDSHNDVNEEYDLEGAEAGNCECEEEQAVLVAYQVNNVSCLFQGPGFGYAVIMEIVGQEERLIQVSVCSQKDGDAMVRALVEKGYLDLTSMDVYIGEMV